MCTCKAKNDQFTLQREKTCGHIFIHSQSIRPLLPEITPCRRERLSSCHFSNERYQITRDCKTYLDRVELDTSLDDIDWSESSVCEGAADTTRGSSLEVVHHVILGPVIFGRGQKNGTGCRRRRRHGGR
jgi:hypothetical protein